MNLQKISGYLGVGFGCLLIGFLGGQEYDRYEIRSAFNSVADNFQKSLAGLNTDSSPNQEPKAGEPTPAPKQSQPSPVDVEFVSKGFKAADPENGDFEDDITLTLSFKDVSSKDIRAFDGTIEFTDLLGNPLKSVSLAINDPISADASNSWVGTIKYNQFEDDDQRLRNADSTNVKMTFVPGKVLFKDGSSTQF